MVEETTFLFNVFPEPLFDVGYTITWGKINVNTFIRLF